MITEKYYISSEEDTSQIEKAAAVLREGGNIAIPTETVYGLAANALDENAVSNIFKAKGRPQDNPLIVHICEISEIYDLVLDMPKEAISLAEKFWPGPLTIILKRSEKIPATVSAGLDTVAIRMPSDRIARAIIKAAGVPLAAPSANLSSSPSPTTAQRVIDDLDSRINGIVVSHDCEVGVESTVVTLATNPPRLLRPGAVTLEMLREILPDIKVDAAVLAEPEKDKPVASPGMKYKHYAPKSEVFLVKGTREQYVSFVNSKKESGAVALCFGDEAEDIKIKTVVYGASDDAAKTAKELFEALRKIDDFGGAVAYAHSPDTEGIGLAVYNRLIRAAGFKVIEL